MKILVYGAGVLGSNLAADLYSSGKNVTLLARGSRADTLERDGLIIDPLFSFRKKRFAIPVIRELKEDDFYDVIFVVMRYTQLESVVPVLLSNCSRNIVFIGNNLSCDELAAKLETKNVMFGFYMAAGHREQDRVVSISLHKLTIGQLSGSESNQEFIDEIFRDSRIRISYQPNMGDYLLCHAAFVVPIAFACYYCDGDLRKIKDNKPYLNRMISANIEGYAAIEDAGHTILPESDQDYRSPKYRRLCFAVYRIMCATVIGKICASDHALNAVEEMAALNHDLKRFYISHNGKCPNYRKLEKDAETYLKR